MKINFEQPITNLKGENLKEKTKTENDKIEERDITLSMVCTGALLTAYQDEKIDSVEKLRRYKLAQRLVDAKEENITIEEANLLKELIGKNPSPLIVGQVFEILEQVKEEPEPEPEAEAPAEK